MDCANVCQAERGLAGWPDALGHVQLKERALRGRVVYAPAIRGRWAWPFATRHQPPTGSHEYPPPGEPIGMPMRQAHVLYANYLLGNRAWVE